MDQETQLVKIKNEVTEEGKVDLGKIMDIRKAIKRRYANRTSLNKIFSAWDSKKQGCVDLEDVMKMVSKLGINMNKDEAKMLL